ncbi:MAG: CvpA family protein [Verrucomicrobia bacterium]|nr:CvpA family protein [Verrucomicrobiota bacterium]
MSLMKLQVNWVDIAVFLLVLGGVLRGRARGMSRELLDMAQWLLVLVLAAVVYEPGGRWLSEVTLMGLLSGYVGAYGLVVVLVILGFSLLRGQLGEKLSQRDTFGKGEFYLGMAAGGFRHLCMLLVCLAFLNARYFTPQELQAQQRFQMDNYGHTYFPTLGGIQNQVFERSCSGRLVRDYLPAVLIRATAPGERPGAAHPRHRPRASSRG